MSMCRNTRGTMLVGSKHYGPGRSVLLASLAALCAVAGCSGGAGGAGQGSAPQAAASAGTASPAAATKSASWAGHYVVNYAADKDSNIKPGGASVIWNGDASATNEFELKPSDFNLSGLETYQCIPDATMTAAWHGCLFIRVGTQPLKRLNLPSHPLPVKAWDHDHQDKSIADVAPIAAAVLGDFKQPDTERLVGSFIKDGKIEYMVLYRLADAREQGGATAELLFIDLKDPSVGTSAFENGWGVGGKK